MKIEYIDKFDFYVRGNYIRSFDSYDEIMDYFDTHYSGYTDDYLNRSCFTVIPSKHLKFS